MQAGPPGWILGRGKGRDKGGNDREEFCAVVEKRWVRDVTSGVSAGDGVPVHHSTADLLLTICVNPTRRQLRDLLRAVLLATRHARYRHVIYSGPALAGSGCWLLCDGPFSADDLVGVLVDDAATHGAPVCVSAFDQPTWTTRLTRAAVAPPHLQVM